MKVLSAGLLLLAATTNASSQTAFQWPDSSQYSRVLVNVNQYISTYLRNHPGWFTQDRVVTDFAVVDTAKIGMQAAQQEYTTTRQVLESKGMYVGTYVSGTTVQPEAEDTQWPYGRVPTEWMSANATYSGSWSASQANRKFINVNDPNARQSLQAGIARLWNQFPAPLRFVDNAAAHSSTGAKEPWPAYCANLAGLRRLAESTGSTVIFNIAMHAGLLSDQDVQQLIQAVGTNGVLVEEPWAPAIRARPDLTAKSVARYRQLLNAGMAIIMLPYDVPPAALAQWVATWRKPADHLYLGGTFWKAPDPAVYGPFSR